MAIILRFALTLTLAISFSGAIFAAGSPGKAGQSRTASGSLQKKGTSQARVIVEKPGNIQFEEMEGRQPVTARQKTIPRNLVLQPNFPPPPPTTNNNKQPQFATAGHVSKVGQPVNGVAANKARTQQKLPVRDKAWTLQPTLGELSTGVASPVAVTSPAPQITTRVIAPRFVNLNQIAPVRIQIRNTASDDARQIKLIAILPPHAKFMAAQPQPTLVNGQQFEFVIDQLGGNQTREIQIDVIPTTKKPINIQTDLWINNHQIVEVGVREPKLQISATGPSESHTGKHVVHTVTIENIGDGIAEDIKLSCLVPGQVELLEGQQDYFMRQLTPGRSAQIQFKSAAYKAGEIEMNFAVASKGLETVKTVSAIHVFQPQLVVSASGPQINFVHRDGIYSIQVENTGQVDVTEVELAVAVPEGMKVTTVSRQANVNKVSGILIWKFKRLAAGAQESIQLKAQCDTAGRQVYQVAASCQETRTEKFELITEVQTRSNVSINVNSQSGPVEIGSPAKFSVWVENKGSSAAEGVEVIVELPPALMAVPQEHFSVGDLDNTLRYPSIDLKAGEKKELVFEASGANKGEHVVRAILTVKDSARRLIAEDSVFVFETDLSKVSESLQPEIRR